MDYYSTSILLFFLFLIFKYVRRNRTIKSEDDGPLLSSADMLTSPGLKSLNKATIGPFNYNLMVNESGRVMVFVDIGKNTDLHLIATGDESGVSPLVSKAISKKWLIPIELEGDFPDYFKLYASPNKEVEVRELFNPTNMVGFIDFCRNYDFELFDEELFISQAANTGYVNTDNTLIATIEAFLQKNAQVLLNL